MTDHPLSPLAELLFVLHATVLGPKPDAISPPIHPALRCPQCHSPKTRVKALEFYPAGVAPITGFTGRCRVCGGTAVYTVDLLERRAA